MPVSIDRQQVPALFLRVLLGRAAQQVGEALGALRQANPSRGETLEGQLAVATDPGIARLRSTRAGRGGGDLAARTRTGVDPTLGHQSAERRLVDPGAIALALGRRVGGEAEPLEVLEQGSFELGSGANPIVILDAEQDSTAEGTGDPPDMEGVEDMAEMQEAGGRRRETGGEARRRAGSSVAQGVQLSVGTCGETGKGAS
jgi:hypothetical protein